MFAADEKNSFFMRKGEKKLLLILKIKAMRWDQMLGEILDYN